MVRLYWYGLAIIYMAACAAGMVLGYTWGIGGSILGIVLGAMMASGVAMALNTPERMEAAIYGILSMVFITGLVWLIVTFWGVRI
ncbi:hypothetical protein [Roseicyclus mahoneyensis]|uniref:Uncharacterized protein n=1 Tax=Roseicyclus mahoneyensis TaxID=164332 RepID=A0A316GNP7_9RHOB|nr:hypothetical protein [Roseicyclus mahoneyensis]PWK61073.1 hypothetical protein C7455_103273 [Roseicyclus mahoneyensis]